MVVTIRLSTNGAGLVASFADLSGLLYGSTDHVAMAALYRMVRVNRISITALPAQPYAFAYSGNGAYGYNPATYSAPAGVQNIAELEQSIMTPLILA
jgi:hypothetical protein